jgi:nitroreductase
MEFSEVIKKRKSTRSFLPKKVEEEKITFLLECARRAPSWANKQCWRFIVVTDQHTIHALARTSIINRWLKQAPCIIVACGDPTSSGINENISYFIVDVSIAFEHLVLAATDVGLGSCWIGRFNEKQVKEILLIPPRIRVVGMTPIGYPLEQETLRDKTVKKVIRSTSRKQLREIVHYEKW